MCVCIQHTHMCTESQCKTIFLIVDNGQKSLENTGLKHWFPDLSWLCIRSRYYQCLIIFLRLPWSHLHTASINTWFLQLSKSILCLRQWTWPSWMAGQKCLGGNASSNLQWGWELVDKIPASSSLNGTVLSITYCFLEGYNTDWKEEIDRYTF